MAKIKETDLFEPVKEWFLGQHDGYEVYTEVTRGYGAKRADVVLTHGPAMTVIELKTSLSLDLLEQAVYWLNYADYVYIAVPKPKSGPINGFARDLMRERGIGILLVDTTSDELYAERETYARFNRAPFRSYLKEALTDHNKEAAGHLQAGSTGGGFYTPYRHTMQGVREYLERLRQRPPANSDPDGWVRINEILDHCETHYASPKASLSNSLRSFESDWCEWKKEGGKLWFRATRVEPVKRKTR